LLARSDAGKSYRMARLTALKDQMFLPALAIFTAVALVVLWPPFVVAMAYKKLTRGQGK
jgi:hypothetical protein